MSAKTTELKPCPFCGGEASINRPSGRMLFCVVCDDCDANSGYYFTEEDAARAWNSRAERTCHNDLKGSDYRGVWPIPHFKCSSCGVMLSFYEFEYCPTCGAKVVGE